MGPANSLHPDYFRAHQELLKRVTTNLGLEAEELKESMDALFDILAAVAPTKVALLVREGVVKLVKALWQIPSSLPSTSKMAEKKYYVPARDLSTCTHTLSRSPSWFPPLMSRIGKDRQVPFQKIRRLNAWSFLSHCKPSTSHCKPAGAAGEI